MILDSLFSPLSLLFLIIVIGYYVGKIKIRDISFDLAGVLLVAVIIGYAISNFCIINLSKQTDVIENMNVISSLGTTLFIAVIGITAGYTFDIKNKDNKKALLVGNLMVISAFVTMYLISILGTGLTKSEIVGSFCGALTTTPGLAAVCELENIVSEEAVIGYGSAYLFGVIFTVLFVQMISKGMQTRKEDKLIYYCDDTKKQNLAALDGFIQVAITVVIGRSLGNIQFFENSFSVGSSGGILSVGILLGSIVKKYTFYKCASKEIMSFLRNIGLVLFFAGTGITTGMQMSNIFKLETMLIGVVMTVVPLVVGWIICVYILKCKFTTSAIIAGGMTSTPAIGVLIKINSNPSIDSYSTAYVGALITVITLIRCIHF